VGSGPKNGPFSLGIFSVAGLDNRSAKGSVLVVSGMAPAWHQPQKERLTVRFLGGS